MKIEDIKIFPCFKARPPKQEKMQNKERYYQETGLLQSEIILDGAGNLAADCIAQAGREIRQLKGLLFLSLVVNVVLAGAVIVAVVLR